MVMLVVDAPVVEAEEAEPTVREVLVEQFGVDWASQVDHVASVQLWAPNRKVVNEDGSVEWLMHERDFLVLRHTMRCDPFNAVDPIDLGNHRHLIEEWGALARSYGWGDAIAVELDHTAPVDLLEVLGTLGEGIVLDDDLRCEAEQELLSEHWNDYGLHSAKQALANELGVWDFDLTDHAESVLERLAFGGWVDHGYSGGYPEFPHDPSCASFGEDEIADWIARRLGRVVTMSRFGHTVVFDLRTRLMVVA